MKHISIDQAEIARTGGFEPTEVTFKMEGHLSEEAYNYFRDTPDGDFKKQLKYFLNKEDEDMKQEEKSSGQLYKEMQDRCGLEVGDTVKVVRTAADYEMGWALPNLKNQLGYVGCKGTIHKDAGQAGFIIRFKVDLVYLPFFCLQLVEKAPKFDFSDFETVKKLHREMWQWLEDNPTKNKEEWPRWESNGGDVPDADNECFLCEYTFRVKSDGLNCAEVCPANWLADESPENGCVDTLFGAWLYASADLTRRRIAKAIKNAV